MVSKSMNCFAFSISPKNAYNCSTFISTSSSSLTPFLSRYSFSCRKVLPTCFISSVLAVTPNFQDMSTTEFTWIAVPEPPLIEEVDIDPPRLEIAEAVQK